MIQFQNCAAAVSRLLLTVILAACCYDSSHGQQVQQYLDDGEFSAAIGVAQQDQAALQLIAREQASIGETDAALQTFNSVRDGNALGSTLGNVLNFSNGSDQFNGGGDISGTVPNGGGSNGGITANDFNTLIQLVQNTVAADSWEANGAGNGTIFPFPTGVFVDGEGVLNRIPKTRKTFASIADFEDELLARGPIHQPAKMRKVSLTRLERAVQRRAVQGKSPTEAMLHLAGLTDIRYIMVDPGSGEVIIAGPAGGWKRNTKGKIVSKVDQQPVLMLEDLVACLRNAWGNAGKFGCAIVPRKENLAATKKYVDTTKGRGKKWENGLRNALGHQDIDVFGIAATSHAAQVLVEADYHMKLVGMGIEPSIPSVPGYLQRVELDANGNPPPMDVVRWWFALNYERLICNEAQTLFEFTGPGVKVLAETEFINKDGERIHTGKAVGPTKSFARDFTDHFVELANVYPIYNELKNIFDLAIVANLIHDYQLNNKANWDLPYFVSTDKSPVKSFQLSRLRPAKSVLSVMNRHIIKERKNGETTIHTLVGVSGGVSFDAKSFVSAENLQVERDVEFTGQLAKAVEKTPELEVWWWD